MGNKKNKGNPHASRAKFKKRTPTSRWKRVNVEEPIGSFEGSRIINLKQLAAFIRNVSAHSQSCHFGTIYLTGETYRHGLASVLTAKCSGCCAEVVFSTSSRVSTLKGKKRWECNLAAVWGQMATGGGHAPLTETMSVLGIPSMTKKSFMSTEKAIGEWWWDSLQKSMNKAAKEEKQKAIERGSFHEGIPAITVIVDAGWSKRTHKHSYNANSGAGIIIGLETGKILYAGVRNKYCSVCNRAEKQGKPPQEHNCYKNWDSPSSSMETDIIVEGFREAESKYGLRYTTFIGDGDSSVYASLVTQVPVWGHAIQKAECANHAIKCYRGALEKLVQEKPKYKGKGKLTEKMRKRLTAAARCAIKMRSKHPDKRVATELLQKDLRNSPLHCFGIHKQCSTDYCKKTPQIPTPNPMFHEEQEPTDDPTMSPLEEVPIASIASQEIGFWEDAVNDDNLDAVRYVETQPPNSVDPEMMLDIQRLVGRLISKASQLRGIL